MPSPTSPNTSSSSDNAESLTIVGIGASAGGLAALKTFFSRVPDNSDLAYVVVVHLSPDNKSHLADLLQSSSKMPVQQVTETVKIEKNQVYLIPPNANLDTIDTHLRLSELEAARRDRAPIDHFFRTLANVHDGHAIGVILTGTGSDGTLGIREIKGRGGVTIVQDPNEAEFDGMPLSAIATGLIDVVLPLAKIPRYLTRFSQTRPRVLLAEQVVAEPPDELPLLHKIFVLVKSRTGRDFTYYKRTTIMRRLRRRMQIAQIENLPDYLTFLRKEPEEVIKLSDDFLITVTSFFRDTSVFALLQKQVVPRLFSEQKAGESIRVWSVGCSTGEEAYSLTIMLLEEAAQRDTPPEIQVFASDLHEESLYRAREGFYPGDIKVDVSEERLRRFFVAQEGGYRIRKEVRDRVVFAPHNLMSDPPFSKIDLIVCRNVLIYLQRDMQRNIIDLFHYALQPGGTLLLGSSETIEGTELFQTEDKGNCLFRKRNVPPPELHLPVFPITQSRSVVPAHAPADKTEPVVYGALHHRIVERYAPPSLLLTPDHRVVHLSERVGQYLLHPGGELTSDVFKLIPTELHLELRMALHTAHERQELVRTKPIAVNLDGNTHYLSLSVFPDEEPQREGFSVVIFERLLDFSLPAATTTQSADQGTETDEVVQSLQNELDRTKQRLQGIVEEYETSQEEMKASNEEMQSTNEELRSTMEELETSKEELQSMNEELSTLNQENRHKVEELSQLSSDLQNLLAATDIATLFLDRKFRIMRFTPRASELFNVRHLDRGRPLSDLTHHLGYSDLQEDAQRVLTGLVPVEREVQDDTGRWYLTRVLPYRSSDDRIEGVVITFIDITQRRESEEALRKSEEHLRLTLESAIDYAIFTLNMNGVVTDWNAGAERIFGYQRQEIIGQSGSVVFVDEDRSTEPQRELEQGQEQGRVIYERWHLRKDGSTFWGSGALMPLRRPDRQIRGFLKILVDNTDRRAMEQDLRQAKETAERAAYAKEEFLAHMSHEIRTPLNAIVGLTGLLLSDEILPEQKEYLEGLRVSSENLVALVNDILDFSKIEAGKVSVEDIPFDLTALLKSLEATHQPAAQQNGNQLVIKRLDDLPTHVAGDPGKLIQVLNNLLSNALKFTRDGRVTLEATVAHEQRDEVTIQFSVQDTGVGIPADQLDTIFDKFTQADSSTKRNYGGTGLGLTITRRLLELMGSHIAVESEVGKGTRFHFKLSTKRIDEPSAPSTPSPSDAAPEPVDLPLRVLLVEDVAINRMVLQQYLRTWWRVVADEAINGAEAIALIEKNDYDLVLMDVRMPVMDGYEAVAIIRGMESPTKNQVPVVALTADTKKKVNEEQTNHFTEVLTKPFDPTELRRVINAHLQLPQSPL